MKTGLKVVSQTFIYPVSLIILQSQWTVYDFRWRVNLPISLLKVLKTICKQKQTDRQAHTHICLWCVYVHVHAHSFPGLFYVALLLTLFLYTCNISVAKSKWHLVFQGKPPCTKMSVNAPQGKNLQTIDLKSGWGTELCIGQENITKHLLGMEHCVLFNMSVIWKFSQL
jgi:hypothetical protein